MKKLNKKIMTIILILFIISGLFIFNSVKAQSIGLSRPQDNPTKAHLNATVIDYAWLGSRPFEGGDSIWFYNLPANTRILVDYESNGYYFIEWYFNDVNEPIYAWTDKSHIILDIEVTPIP